MGRQASSILMLMDSTTTYDEIPLEDNVQISGPDERGMMSELFYAFNTVITLQAFAEPDRCRTAFAEARAACRDFERRYSRTLPHSDIARLNAAKGAPVAISNDTAALLRTALRYCAESEGVFDITMGAVVRLWNFHAGIIPDQERLDKARAHVDWRAVSIWGKPNVSALTPEAPQTNTPQNECCAVRHKLMSEPGESAHNSTLSKRGTQSYAQLNDAYAAVDVGGIAKGWIADRLAEIIARHDIGAFIVNLGGNVVAHGEKPDGTPWRVGLQDPRNKEAILGAIAVYNASAVTSGVYERCFEKEGAFYHHILDPQTGFPVKTDAAGVTVITQYSIDAEGYSTTLLALGIERGIAFARSHPEILQAYFVDHAGVVHTSQPATDKDC